VCSIYSYQELFGLKVIANTNFPRRALSEVFRAATDEIRGAIPTLVGLTPPGMTLLIHPYMDKDTGLMMLYDRPELMEELMDMLWQIDLVFLGAAADCGVDIYRIAVNGYEWLSPSLYESYMIPQARQVAQFAEYHGALSWVHTCGKLRDIASSEAYQRMGVGVVESLSSPPTGDVVDLAETRRDIGDSIVTRGGINCELFYAEDADDLRARTEYVLESTSGFRHIIGDTNPPFPPYPWRNIEALMEVVRSTQRSPA